VIKPEVLHKIIELRHHLHQFPELSGQEKSTPEAILNFLKRDYMPDQVLNNLGGTGMAVIYDSGKKGPTVMFRCELDALPIKESNSLLYKSKNEGISHKCGHDGHMAIITGLGTLLSQNRPGNGRVILLYQPAEETGEGALAILKDERFTEIKPDWIFALHNLPNHFLKEVIIKEGSFTAASKGMAIKLLGATSHAAEPEKGRSPALAMASIIESLDELAKIKDRYSRLVLITIVHAILGEKAYGTTPGYAEVHATLRAYNNEDMEILMEKAERAVKEIANNHDLEYDISYTEEFPSTHNDPEAVAIIRKAAMEIGLACSEPNNPMKWSEDFSHFAQFHKAAFFGIGAGENVKDLHNEDYDFIDDLIAPSINLLYKAVNLILDEK
jgi:amidohydrolase